MFRKRSGHDRLRPRDRMRKGQPVGMEEQRPWKGAAVAPVTDDRVARVGQVKPDLVRPARQGFRGDQRPPRTAPQHSKVRAGRLSFPFRTRQIAAFSAADVLFRRPPVGFRNPLTPGQV